MRLEPGQVYGGKYRIVRLIGQGGMGAVYEGENVGIHRRVAIKTLHAGLAANAATAQRFEREAQAAGRIGSAHICEVLDAGELPDGDRFMVMEFLDGVTLQQRVRQRGRIPPAEAAPIVHELLEGLAAAHHAGIVHRDLKPANVFLVRSMAGRPDFVKILDFGVSKFNVLSAEEASMTRTGAVLGTPYYMSPEQAKGSREVDARSDVYAVGVILYECVTGQVPFHAETFNELIFKIVLDAPLPAESFVPDLDPGFAAILRRAMAREASERYQSARELQQALGDWIVRSAGGTRTTPANLAGPAPAPKPQSVTAPFPAQPPMHHPARPAAPAPAPPQLYHPHPPTPPAAAQPVAGPMGTVMLDDASDLAATRLASPRAPVLPAGWGAPPPAPAPAVAPGGTAYLAQGAPTPPAAFAHSDSVSLPVKKSPLPLLLGVFAAALLVGGAIAAAVAFGFRNGATVETASTAEPDAPAAPAPTPDAPPGAGAHDPTALDDAGPAEPTADAGAAAPPAVDPAALPPASPPSPRPPAPTPPRPKATPTPSGTPSTTPTGRRISDEL